MISRPAIVAALLLLAGVYACRASGRTGLFNNVVDKATSVQEHDAAWTRGIGGVVAVRRLLRPVRDHGGDCSRIEPVYGPRLFCQVETPGRLSAMMPSVMSRSIILERGPTGWHLVKRDRGEIGL